MLTTRIYWHSFNEPGEFVTQTAFKIFTVQPLLVKVSVCILGMAQHHCIGWCKPPLFGLCRSRHCELRQLSFVTALQYQNAAFDHEIMNIKNILSERCPSASSWLPVCYSLILALPMHCWGSHQHQLLGSVMFNFIMKCSPWCKCVLIVLVEEKCSVWCR